MRVNCFRWPQAVAVVGHWAASVEVGDLLIRRRKTMGINRNNKIISRVL